MITFCFIAIYMLVGLYFAVWFDEKEMKKHVPYGSVSSIVPLRTIRIVVMVIGMLCTIPVIIYSTVTVTIYRVKSRIKLRQAMRGLDKIAKKDPRIAEKWYPVRKRILTGERIPTEKKDGE